jgi:WhiB family redox-sensing transcriptional regulator
MFQIRHIETKSNDIHWRLKAACQNSDPELFMPHSRFTQSFRVAVEICQGCPVRSQCLDVAQQSRETTGVWGGILFQANGEQYEAS